MPELRTDAEAKRIIRERLKMALAREISDRTGVGYLLEYMFAAPDRRWRSDVAWPDVRVALEIDGGTWIMGRHNRPSHMRAEMDKRNGYAERGWSVVYAMWDMLESRTDAELIEVIVRAIDTKKSLRS